MKKKLHHCKIAFGRARFLQIPSCPFLSKQTKKGMLFTCFANTFQKKVPFETQREFPLVNFALVRK